MRLFGWRRRRNTGDGEFPQGLDAALARDEQLSAYLDSELDEREAVAVEDALGADPALATQLDELRVVREALGSLGELRAPRPFTFEAPATAVRHAPGRLELVFRMGAVAAAVAFAVVLTGDFVGLGDEGVEGWGVSRPSFGGGGSEQASDAPQALSAVAPEAATAASTPQTAPTPVATVAQAAATVAATATPAATSAPSAVAAAAASAEPTVGQGHRCRRRPTRAHDRLPGGGAHAGTVRDGRGPLGRRSAGPDRGRPGVGGCPRGGRPPRRRTAQRTRTTARTPPRLRLRLRRRRQRLPLHPSRLPWPPRPQPGIRR